MSGLFQRLRRAVSPRPAAARSSGSPRLPDRREWNEDWAVGDLAECLHDGWHPHDSSVPHPRCGDVLRVRAVVERPAMVNGRPAALVIGLSFEGKPPGFSWNCTSFRKLRPDHTAADPAFAALLRLAIAQPVRVPTEREA